MEMTQDQIGQSVGRFDQIAGITPFRFSSGRADGCRALRVTNGGLTFTAVADRALDVSQIDFHGTPLCWRSPNGEAAPAYYEPEADEWLRTFFGGLFTTCGLSNFGPAGEDRWGKFGLHGRINCLPAEEVRCSHTWDGEQYVLEISGTVRQTKVLGEQLTLRRTLRTSMGSNRLELHDVVTNEGAAATPHMILYHCNGGFPLLADGSRLYVSTRKITPRDEEAASGRDVWNQGAAPQPGFAEQVFIHEPVGCGDGRAAALLVNERLNGGNGIALRVRFDPKQLPAFFSWRMLGAHTYVMGMEPANCPTIEGRLVAGQRGTLPMLEAGASRRYDLEFDVLHQADLIKTAIRSIDHASANQTSYALSGKG